MLAIKDCSITAPALVSRIYEKDPKNEATVMKYKVEISNFLSYKNTINIKVTKNKLLNPIVWRVKTSRIIPLTKANKKISLLFVTIAPKSKTIKTKGIVVTVVSSKSESKTNKVIYFINW